MLHTYSFDQIALFARCVMVHRVSMLNMLLGPAVGAMGGEYNPANVGSGQKDRAPSRPKKRPTRAGEKRSEFAMSEFKTDEEKERALSNAFALAGAPIRSVGSE